MDETTSEESVAARVLSLFDVSGEFGRSTISPISTGLIHRTFEIANARGRYILQRVNPIFSRKINSNIAKVTEHLAARGQRTLELMQSRGKPYVDLGGDGVWRLMTRLPGVSFDLGQSAAQLRAAGRHVGFFHNALSDFDLELDPIGFPYHDTPLHLRDLQHCLAKAGNHPLLSEVIPLAERIIDASASLPRFPNVPVRVIHGDLKFNNLLFESNDDIGQLQTVALIDLDTLARMPLWVDWGDAWRSWCNRAGEDQAFAELDLALFEAAAEGLMSALSFRPGQEELESISWGLEWIALELSMRFATDAVLETHFAWDSSRYQRSGQHQLQRARGQFSLFEQARDSHDQRAGFLRG